MLVLNTNVLNQLGILMVGPEGEESVSYTYETIRGKDRKKFHI